MLVFHKYGIKIYAVELPSSSFTRGHGRVMAERAAIKRLLREAFPRIADLRIGHFPSGAPFLTLPAPDGSTPDSPLGGPWKPISISHCRTMAALAVAPRGYRIGIDCETDDRFATLEKVARRFLTDEQMEHWNYPPASLWAWTTKEAAYKAISSPQTEFCSIPLPMEIPLEEATADGTINVDGRNYNVMQIDADGVLPAFMMMVYAEHNADFDSEPYS